jgi:hypothetical protein
MSTDPRTRRTTNTGRHRVVALLSILVVIAILPR